jgi:hypothetical protein
VTGRPRAVFDGSCWPAPTEELLLKAALLDGAEAPAAWRQWLAGERLESAHVSERRLLPAVYRNMVRLGIEDTELGRLRGIHRQDWYRNQLLFDAAGQLVAALEAAGVPTLVLKGAALVMLHYGDAGSRAMGDVDVLVPPELATRAIELARDEGWHADPPAPPDLLAIFHAWTYSDGGAGMVDLHWRAFPYSRADERDLWENTVPLELGAARTRAPCPADQLAHVIGHGLEWNAVSPVRWIPDVVAVLRSPEHEIDWDRFCSLVTHHGFALPAADMLRYLRESFEPAVPEQVIERLRATPASRRERRVQEALMGRPYHVRRAIRLHRAAYRALDAPAARGARPLGFARFVVARWRLHGWSDLPRYVRHKLSLRLREPRARRRWRASRAMRT